MSLAQLSTREFMAIAVLAIIALIIIAIKVYQFKQDSDFQNDLNKLELNDFVDKYSHEIPEEELTMLWKRVQSDQDEQSLLWNWIKSRQALGFL